MKKKQASAAVAVERIKTVGLFPSDVRLNYVDHDVVVATLLDGPQVVLRNGSSKSLSYALRMTDFRLKRGGEWRVRQDGLRYHALEAL